MTNIYNELYNHYNTHIITPQAKILHGPMQHMLKALPDNSVDSVVCDPPYGIDFMGKSWDNAYPPADWWAECFRVLKPGGHLIAFAATRTYHHAGTNIEAAGFEIRDMISWLYGSGFPKSYNIGKAIDKRGGAAGSAFAKALKEAREARNLTKAECDTKYCNGATMWSWYEGRKGGIQLPSYEWMLNLLNDGWEELTEVISAFAPTEREVVGQYAGDAGGLGGERFSTNKADITVGQTDWEGWGTALKPACEPCVLARKPLSVNGKKATVVDNVLEHGTGAINIDACRVPTDDVRGGHRADAVNTSFSGKTEKPQVYTEGRWPANLIHDGSEEATQFFPETGAATPTKGKGNSGTRSEGNDLPSTGHLSSAPSTISDNGGSAARYFYSAKVSKKERNRGLDSFETKQLAVSGGAQSNGADYQADKKAPVGLNRPKQYQNNHPTVKPHSLMSYLIKLVTPVGGTVLDPFNGSGSTGCAAVSNGFNYIGVEMDADYLEISKARIKDAAANPEAWNDVK
jgi:DNA modification methylase